MKRLQRRNDKFIQEGKGLRELYQKLCVCKDEKFQKIVLGLSDREIFRICQCVYSYLEGLKVKNDDGFNEYIKLDTNIKHHMCNVVYGDNSMKERRKFLGSDENGNALMGLVFNYYLPHFFLDLKTWIAKNTRKITKLKKKIEEIAMKSDNVESDDESNEESSESSSSDEESGTDDESNESVSSSGDESDDERESDEEDSKKRLKYRSWNLSQN